MQESREYYAKGYLGLFFGSDNEAAIPESKASLRNTKSGSQEIKIFLDGGMFSHGFGSHLKSDERELCAACQI
jgi:hypothetical protein